MRPVPKPKTEPAPKPVKKIAPDATMEFTELQDAVSVDDLLAGFPMEGENDVESDSTRRLPTGELSDALAAMEAKSEEEEEELEENFQIEKAAEEESLTGTKAKKSSITTVVKGATLQEALANGVSLANGINREEKRKMEQREEEIASLAR